MLSKLIRGDCFSVLPKLLENHFQLVFADPPYNTGSTKLVLRRAHTNGTSGDWKRVDAKWDQFVDHTAYRDFTTRWMEECLRVIKPTGTLFICCSHHSIEAVLYSIRRTGLRVLNIITWQKANPMPNLTRRMLTHSTEFIVWVGRNPGWIFNYEQMKTHTENGVQLGDVWRFPVVGGKQRLKNAEGKSLHPTQKPEALVGRCLEMASNTGDWVLDPFGGTMTTAVMCLRLNRRFICVEKDREYYTRGVSRLRLG